MSSRSQVPSTPARSAKSRRRAAFAYPSPASSPDSSLTDARLSISSDSTPSSPTSSPLIGDIDVAEELREDRTAEFLPGPWDPVAYEDSMNHSPDKIPRPPNSFMLFRSHLLKYIIPKHMSKKQQSASRLAGFFWKHKSLPRAVKEAWNERAKTVRDWHKEKYPNYKFSPRKPAAKADRDDDGDEEQCQLLLRTTYFRPKGTVLQPRTSKRKQPRSLRRIGSDSDYEDADDDDEYVPRSRPRTGRRATRRSTTHLPALPTPTRRPAGPSASPYGATGSLYPTPPISPQARSGHVARLLELRRILNRELAVAQAGEAALASCGPSLSALDLPHAAPQFSFPFMPSFMQDFGAIHMGAAGFSNMPFASSSQHAFNSYKGNMLGLDGAEDVFGSVRPASASQQQGAHDPAFPSLWDFQGLPGVDADAAAGADAPAPTPAPASSPAQAAATPESLLTPEEMMNDFFNYDAYSA